MLFQAVIQHSNPPEYLKYLNTIDGRKEEFGHKVLSEHVEWNSEPLRTTLTDFYAKMIISQNQNPDGALFWMNQFLKPATRNGNESLLASFNLSCDEMVALTRAVWEIFDKKAGFDPGGESSLVSKVLDFEKDCKFDGKNRIRWLLLTLQGGYDAYHTFDKGNPYKMAIDLLKEQARIVGIDADKLMKKIAGVDVVGMQVG